MYIELVYEVIHIKERQCVLKFWNQTTHGLWPSTVSDFSSSYFSWISYSLYSVLIFVPKPRRKKWKNRELSISKLACMIVELLRWSFRWLVQAKVMFCEVLIKVHMIYVSCIMPYIYIVYYVITPMICISYTAFILPHYIPYTCQLQLY